jgi:hypothetical protein
MSEATFEVRNELGGVGVAQIVCGVGNHLLANRGQTAQKLCLVNGNTRCDHAGRHTGIFDAGGVNGIDDHARFLLKQVGEAGLLVGDEERNVAVDAMSTIPFTEASARHLGLPGRHGKIPAARRQHRQSRSLFSV